MLCIVQNAQCWHSALGFEFLGQSLSLPGVEAHEEENGKLCCEESAPWNLDLVTSMPPEWDNNQNIFLIFQRHFCILKLKGEKRKLIFNLIHFYLIHLILIQWSSQERRKGQLHQDKKRIIGYFFFLTNKSSDLQRRKSYTFPLWQCTCCFTSEVTLKIKCLWANKNQISENAAGFLFHWGWLWLIYYYNKDGPIQF